MRRPVAVLVPTLGLLLVLGWPFLHVRFNAPDSTILPASVPSRAAFDRLAATFGEGEFAPLTLAIRTTGPATSPDNLAALYDYSRRLAADPRISRVEGLVDVDPRLGLDQYQLLYARPQRPARPVHRDGPRRDDEGRPDRVHRLHAVRAEPGRGPRARGRPPRHRPGPLAPPPGTTVLVGGGAADVTDVVNRVAADFPRTALFIVVTTYLVLFVLLRSAVLPIKALVMNTLSIVASFGALVWIFQDGNLSGAARVPAARVRRDDPAGDPVLRAVRAVDGLRGVPAVADEGGLGPDPRQPGGGRPRPRAERPDRDVRGADRRRRRGLLRVRRHRPDQGARHRDGARGRPRRDRRPGAARAGDDAPAREVELVGAGLGQARAGRRRRPAGPRQPAPRRAAPPRSSPRRPRPPDDAARRDGRAPPVRPGRDLAARRRRAPRPPDRVVVLHRPPPRRRRRPVRLRVRDLPRRARRAAGLVGVAPRASPTRPATRSATPSGRGSGRASTRRRPTGSAWRLPGRAPSGTPWSMSGGDGHDALDAAAAADAESSTGSGFAPRPPRSTRRSRRRSTTPTAGSTSARPAARTTTRGRRWRPTARSPLGGKDARRSPARLVRPPVGRLHRGRRRRLGLVRGQPRRRDRPDALAGPRTPTAPIRSSTARSSTRHGGVRDRLDRDAFDVARSTGRWTSPATGADLPRGLARSRSPARTSTIDLQPTVADQELDTRASTGVVYWEGSQVVSATRAAPRRSAARAYVELTGYAPAERGGQLGQGVSGLRDRDAGAGRDTVRAGRRAPAARRAARACPSRPACRPPGSGSTRRGRRPRSSWTSP